jgi:ABC-type antimicrobial peptide transport system permease subunit
MELGSLDYVKDEMRDSVPAGTLIDSIYKDLVYAGRTMRRSPATMVLAAIFGGLALLLAAIGIYGVVGYSVSQRTTQEFGVRIALGAQRGDILRHVMRQGMALAIAGITIGCAGALGLSRFLATLLFGVSPVDPVTFGSAALVLAFSALAACWFPAQRAAARDPITVLRVD